VVAPLALKKTSRTQSEVEKMSATDEQIRELAEAIANQAQAIADGTVNGSMAAKAKTVRENAETLRVWLAAREES
jgi:tRNA nucleotidyltransferase (CCA-adding enzyme)